MAMRAKPPLLNPRPNANIAWMTSGAVDRLQQQELGAELTRLLDGVENVLGPPLLARIERQPAHRLARLCAHVRMDRDACNSAAEVESLHATSCCELEYHLGRLREAAGLPHGAQLIASCINPTSYDHLILTLAVRQTCSENWGWDTHVVPESEKPTPDLTMTLSSGTAIALEVKSKLLLKDPTSLLYDEARKIIKSAIDSTGSSQSGQLARTTSSILVVAGFFVDRKLTQLVKKAAMDHFKKNYGRRRTLVGIMLANLLIYSRAAGDPIASLTAALDVDFALNPSYTGTVQIGLLPSLQNVSIGKFQRWDPDVRILPPDASFVHDGDE